MDDNRDRSWRGKGKKISIRFLEIIVLSYRARPSVVLTFKKRSPDGTIQKPSIYRLLNPAVSF